jgi:hypothetical protein
MVPLYMRSGRHGDARGYYDSSEAWWIYISFLGHHAEEYGKSPHPLTIEKNPGLEREHIYTAYGNGRRAWATLVRNELTEEFTDWIHGLPRVGNTVVGTVVAQFIVNDTF